MVTKERKAVGTARTSWFGIQYCLKRYSKQKLTLKEKNKISTVLRNLEKEATAPKTKFPLPQWKLYEAHKNKWLTEQERLISNLNVISYAGLLRKGEVYPQKNCPNRGLRLSDLSFIYNHKQVNPGEEWRANQVQITIRTSKTDQGGKGFKWTFDESPIGVGPLEISIETFQLAKKYRTKKEEFISNIIPEKHISHKT